MAKELSSSQKAREYLNDPEFQEWLEQEGMLEVLDREAEPLLDLVKEDKKVIGGQRKLLEALREKWGRVATFDSLGFKSNQQMNIVFSRLIQSLAVSDLLGTVHGIGKYAGIAKFDLAPKEIEVLHPFYLGRRDLSLEELAELLYGFSEYSDKRTTVVTISRVNAKIIHASKRIMPVNKDTKIFDSTQFEVFRYVDLGDTSAQNHLTNHFIDTTIPSVGY